MKFRTPNTKFFRFMFIDMGFQIISETAKDIIWSGDSVPKHEGVEEVLI